MTTYTEQFLEIAKDFPDDLQTKDERINAFFRSNVDVVTRCLQEVYDSGKQKELEQSIKELGDGMNFGLLSILMGCLLTDTADKNGDAARAMRCWFNKSNPPTTKKWLKGNKAKAHLLKCLESN